MTELHTQFINTKGKTSLDNTFEKAEREGGPSSRFPLGRRWTLNPSRFAQSSSDRERYRKREICLSLLHGRIG
ncbi:MAG: hypothetical protein ACJAT2_000643 [Bacteriovoracaceae bacterium]|jgi:hypothetical protein